MKTTALDYELPSELVASSPLRGQSRLLRVDADGGLHHEYVRHLPRLLRPDDLLVVNNTRVLPARLFARKETGGKMEVLLIEKLDADRWTALARPAKRLRSGSRLSFEAGLDAIVEENELGGRVRLSFSQPVEPLLKDIGHIPLPPYIHRPDTEADRTSYQTVFAQHDGAVAAPTAGLHFDQALLNELARVGIEVTEITLHVGPGTFTPITASDIADHAMEEERYEISQSSVESILEARKQGRRIVAVGTTVVRTLESAALKPSGLTPGAGRTSLFIKPGFDFQVVDLLLTNFHLPRSTLLVMVSAFAGAERIRAAYRAAVTARYRFYSYGDATLLDRARGT